MFPRDLSRYPSEQKIVSKVILDQFSRTNLTMNLKVIGYISKWKELNQC